MLVHQYVIIYLHYTITYVRILSTQMVSQHRQDPSHLNAQLLALSTGSFSSVQIVQSCVMNGVRFNTQKRDRSRITQNSGISVKGTGDTMWYGVLEDIYVVSYPGANTVVLFKCTWFDTSPAKKGVRVYKNRTSIRTTNTFYEDEPFILASQAEQVFYIDDLYNGSHWKVVEHFQHRHIVEAPTINADVDDLVNDETTHGNFQLFVQLPLVEEGLYMSANEAESLTDDDNYASLDYDEDNYDMDGDKYASSGDDNDNNIDDDMAYNPNAPCDDE